MHQLLHLVLIIVLEMPILLMPLVTSFTVLLNSGNSSHPLLANIESSLPSSDLASISVSPHTVSEALLHLSKPNNSDGTLLLSNQFIFASTSFIHLLSKGSQLCFVMVMSLSMSESVYCSNFQTWKRSF